MLRGAIELSECMVGKISPCGIEYIWETSWLFLSNDVESSVLALLFDVCSYLVDVDTYLPLPKPW